MTDFKLMMPRGIVNGFRRALALAMGAAVALAVALAAPAAAWADGTVATVTVDGQTTEYGSLDDALAAANGKTATVKVLQDTELTSDFTLTGDITIDAGDFTVSGNPLIRSEGILAFIGGTFGDVHITVPSNGVLSIDGAYVDYVELSGGDCEIRGGTVGFALCESGELNLHDGTIESLSSTNSSVAVVNYLGGTIESATGYMATLNMAPIATVTTSDGKITEYKDLQEAAEDAGQADCTMTLLRDVVLGSAFMPDELALTGGAILDLGGHTLRGQIQVMKDMEDAGLPVTIQNGTVTVPEGRTVSAVVRVTQDATLSGDARYVCPSTGDLMMVADCMGTIAGGSFEGFLYFAGGEIAGGSYTGVVLALPDAPEPSTITGGTFTDCDVALVDDDGIPPFAAVGSLLPEGYMGVNANGDIVFDSQTEGEEYHNAELIGDDTPFGTYVHLDGATVSEHVCAFDREIVRDDLLASPATCTEPARYYLSCACGKVGTATFAHGDPLGHSYENGVCTVCGAPEPAEEPAQPGQPAAGGAASGAAGDDGGTLAATGDAAFVVVPVAVAGAGAVVAGLWSRRRAS